jgi:uncharacterized protein
MDNPPVLGCASYMHMGPLDDEDGPRVARDLPAVVDAHVHLFPDAVFSAIWRWFDTHAWPIRHKLTSPRVLDFLSSRGVGHVIALAYAHKPGMARVLNAYMAEVTRGDPRVTGLGTVLPGEPGAVAVVEEAFALGLAGIKLHCHVQCFAPDAPELHEIYEACARHDKPLVIHAGREPKSDAYKCDTYAMCAAERIERVLRTHPRLRVCVPHLGADEYDAYLALVARYDTLWLDTTMVLADYFPDRPPSLLHARPDRLMYGTDFPNLPYAWDRELRRIATMGLRPDALEAILGGTAKRFFGV